MRHKLCFFFVQFNQRTCQWIINTSASQLGNCSIVQCSQLDELERICKCSQTYTHKQDQGNTGQCTEHMQSYPYERSEAQTEIHTAASQISNTTKMLRNNSNEKRVRNETKLKCTPRKEWQREGERTVFCRINKKVASTKLDCLLIINQRM